MKLKEKKMDAFRHSGTFKEKTSKVVKDEIIIYIYIYVRVYFCIGCESTIIYLPDGGGGVEYNDNI